MFGFLKRWFSKSSSVVVVPAPIKSDVETPAKNPLGPDVSTSGISNIRCGEIRAIDDDEKISIIAGFALAQAIVKSKEYEEAVLNFSFDQNLVRGLTNDQILSLYQNTIMSVNIEMFTGSYYENHFSKTDAYERNAEGFIRINRYFITTPLEICSAIFHELGHNPLGFTHPKLEQNSVSYGMNQIVESVYPKLKLFN